MARLALTDGITYGFAQRVSRVLLALLAGLAVGMIVGSTRNAFALSVVHGIAPIGTLWINAVRMTVVPEHHDGERADLREQAAVRTELREILGIDQTPLLARVHRWPRAMPQYQVGHLHRLAAIGERLEHLPGVFLAGAGYRGVGIPDCIRDGMAAAESVRLYFDKRG